MASHVRMRYLLAAIAAVLLARYATQAQPTIALTAFPAPGTQDPVSGRVNGLPGGAYKVVMYLSGQANSWWIKPQPNTAAPVDASGAFTFGNWAAYPPADVNFQNIALFVVPAASPTLNVLGGPLPSAAQAGAVATRIVPRGTTADAGGGGTPVTPPAPAPAPAGGVAITATTPALGSVGPVTGRVTGAPAGSNIALYVKTAGGAFWGPKPQPGGLTPIGGDGSFTINNWASGGAGDANAPSLFFAVVPPGAGGQTTLGGMAEPSGGALATATIAKGASGGGAGGGGGGTAPVTPPAGGGGALTFTPPPVGSTAAITGRVTGAPGGSNIAVYMHCGAQIWGSKPNGGATFPVGGDGSFTINGWATPNTGDANCERMTLLVLAPGTGATAVLGAANIPPAVLSGAFASATMDRTGAGGGGGGGAVPTPVPVTPGGGGSAAGEVPFPPADPGAVQRCQNGRINFAGYSWICKDSNGRPVGPGDNLFSANNLWVDNAGLHNVYAPTDGGCGRWAASEVWVDRALGYGTYLVRFVGSYNGVPADITWSPGFTWDDGGNAGNGFREIDFEAARWGNGGDPTCGQFVLRPLQSGAMPPSWRVRYPCGNLPTIWQGQGNGGGGCNNQGSLEFNGAAISKVTCVLKWFRGSIYWVCVDGLYTLASIASVPQSRVIASFTYPSNAAGWVPDPGDARWHINLWHINGNGRAPNTGRRQHHITNGFEFTQANVPMPFAAEAGITWRQLLSKSGVADAEDELRGLDFVPPSHGAAGGSQSNVEVDEDEDEHDDEEETDAQQQLHARGRQLQELPQQRYSSGDPSGLGLMATMQSMQGGGGGTGGGGPDMTGASYPGGDYTGGGYSGGGGYGGGAMQGASYSGGGYAGGQMSGMSVGDTTGAAGGAGGSEGTWAWVSKDQLAQLSQMQAASTAGGGGGGGGGGANKGLVVGLSVAGTLVGLVSLFAGGLLVRRRMKRGETAVPLPMFSPRTSSTGSTAATFSGSSGGGGGMQTRSGVSRGGAGAGSSAGGQRYARLDEGAEPEHELNPLGQQQEGVASGTSSGSGHGGKRGGKVLPTGPPSGSSTSS